MLDATLQFSPAHVWILNFQGSCVKIRRRGRRLSHRDSRGFCFIYRASKPRILNTAEEQVWAQEDRFWDMLLSVTPRKDVVKTQLSFQSKHYQHSDPASERNHKTACISVEDLKLSQEPLCIRSPFSQTWFQVQTKTPALNSHCTTTISPGSVTSVTAAGESGEKEQSRTTRQAPCLKVPTFAH